MLSEILPLNEGSERRQMMPGGDCSSKSGEAGRGHGNGTGILGHVPTLPTGEPVSATFLSSILPHGDTCPVLSLRVDASSVIEGRHSTTCRIILDRPFRRGPDTGDCCMHSIVESVFIKKIACRDLPSRSLGKWRTSEEGIRTRKAAKNKISMKSGIQQKVLTLSWDDSGGVFLRLSITDVEPQMILNLLKDLQICSEATFFETLAKSRALDGIVPGIFWVHIDDRLGRSSEDQSSPRRREQDEPSAEHVTGENEMIEALRESFFMMIMEDLSGTSPSNADNAVRSVIECSTQAKDGRVVANVGKETREAAWEQVSALNLEHAKLVLSAAAHVHASFWTNPRPRLAPSTPLGSSQTNEDDQVPTKGAHAVMDAESSKDYGALGLHEQGTFWSLNKRDPGDLTDLAGEYGRLLERFRPSLPDDWFRESDGGVSDGERRRGETCLGRRLSARARQLDAAAQGVSSANDGRQDAAAAGEADGRTYDAPGVRGRTLVHGDLKTWNVFFRRSDPGGQTEAAASSGEAGRIKFIDWQWCGGGLATADVAYVICTSLLPDVLDQEGELLAHYYKELSTRLAKRFAVDESVDGDQRPAADRAAGPTSATEGVTYSVEQFKSDYRVAFLDYMRCVVGTLWKGLTREKMERNRCSGPGMSMINRSEAHVRWVIERATALLDELDKLEDSCDRYESGAVIV